MVELANRIKIKWNGLREKHPKSMEFLTFFILCNGVTVLQLILMPILKGLFGLTDLVSVNFQILQVGQNLDGSPYYIFDYAAKSIAQGGGGGLAYFLAVEITMAVAQIINFISQRKITFKASGRIWTAALWYVLAYAVITIGTAALQGIYKVPLYTVLMNNMGSETGTIFADVVSMIINCTISFWVFYPIMKLIFKQK